MPDPIRMADSFVFKTDRPWPNPPLTVAAIVGHSTPASGRLWLRTAQTGAFTLLLYRRARILDAAARAALRERLGRVPLSLDDAEGLVTVVRRLDFDVEDLASDTTAVLDVDGLLPCYPVLRTAPGSGSEVGAESVLDHRNTIFR